MAEPSPKMQDGLYYYCDLAHLASEPYCSILELHRIRMQAAVGKPYVTSHNETIRLIALLANLGVIEIVDPQEIRPLIARTVCPPTEATMAEEPER